MALLERIETVLVGNATGLVKSFEEGGAASAAFGAETSKNTGILSKLGLQGKSTGEMLGSGLKLGAAAGLAGIAALAIDGVKHFESMTATVRGFQRVTGASAEDASRLAAATQRMGIDAGTAQTAFGQLAKRIGEGKDTLAQWGVTIEHNRDGTVNFSKTLENISNKYVSLKDSTQRAAFASENFGKGFQSINALLGQGSANLQKFYDIAAAHHQIFSQDDLQKGLDLSRAFKDLETAITGVAVELGRGLVPLLTGFAQEATAVVEALDSIAGSGDGAALAIEGIGTAAALAFGGPIWGVAVAALTAVTIALGDNAQAAKTASDAEHKLGDELDLVSQKNAAKVFEDYVQKAAQFVPAVDSAAGRLKIFKGVVEESAAAGQKLIDAWKAQGINVDAYQKALDKAIAKEKEANANKAASKAANDGLTGSTNASTGAIKQYEQGLKDAATALQNLTNAELGAQGGEIAHAQAVIAAQQAQQTYNDAVAQFGPDSAQAVSAGLALQSAHLQEVATADQARKAQEDLDASLSNPAAIYARIGQLRDEQAAYGDSDGAIQGEIDKLVDLAGKIAAVPPTATTQVTVDTSQAHYALDELSNHLVQLTNGGWTVHVQVVGAP